MNSSPAKLESTSSLQGQLSELMQQVRKHPTDPKLRIHLAQLCMVVGQWERALSQLQAVALMDAASLPFAQMYREAIRCERLRERVYAGELSPPALGQPPHWFALLAQALSHRARGEHPAADALQLEALDLAEACAFEVNGERVEWLADADSRIGPALELIVNGQYYWVPLEDIESLKIDPPVDLRDLVWISAHLTLRNGGQHPVLIPTRYPGSAESGDDALARSSLTRWDAISEHAWAGLGQRMLASDRTDFPLLDIRSLQRVSDPPTDSPSDHG